MYNECNPSELPGKSPAGGTQLPGFFPAAPMGARLAARPSSFTRLNIKHLTVTRWQVCGAKGFTKMAVTSTDYFIPGGAPVDLKVCGNVAEVRFMKHKNGEAHIRKLNKETYLDKQTGEIKEFSRSESRAQNVNSLRQTFNKMRDVINFNFTGKPNELMVTLTYRENMTDLVRLEKDFDRFMKALRRYAKKNLEHGHLEYISAREPQERGAWHLHLLLKFPEMNTVFIPHKDIEKLWEQGFVYVKRIGKITNIGAYLTSYLTNMVIPDDVRTDRNAPEEDIEYLKDVLARPGADGQITETRWDNKRVVKGARLVLYPVGMNIFTKSRGIKYPKTQRIIYEDLKDYGFAPENLTYRSAVEVSAEDRVFKNVIVKEQYTKKSCNWGISNKVFTKKRCEDILADPSRKDEWECEKERLEYITTRVARKKAYLEKLREGRT